MSRFSVTRRAFLLATANITAAQAVKPAYAACSTRLGNEYPFKLGVASGEPLATSVVLWTRFAPYPTDLDFCPAESFPVVWEVALDEQFNRIVRSGVALAEPVMGHSVHVEVEGLWPGQSYWYRFRYNAHESPRGRTKTAPLINPANPSAPTGEALRFAFCSCAEYEEAGYHAYAGMAAEELDFIVHLGDYIYEKTYYECATGAGGTKARCLKHRGEVITLDQYRMRYAEYKLDRNLQAAHAAAPWIVTWDDHEVSNDHAGLISEDNWKSDPAEIVSFIERRAAAYQAYFENMPLRAMARPRGDGHLQLFRSFDFGNLLRLCVLDERQYRALQPCRREREEDRRAGRTDVWKGKSFRPEGCSEYLAEDRSMLGRHQEDWLESQLTGSPARWNVIAQGVMVAELDQRHHARVNDPENRYAYSDTWSGYPVSRDKLLELLARERVSNPIVLSGDIHAFFANQLNATSAQPHLRAGAEFVTGAISSFIERNTDLKSAAQSPCNADTVKFADMTHHGYSVCDLSQDSANVSFIGYPHTRGVILQNPVRKEIASFRVDAGTKTLEVTNGGDFRVDETLPGCPIAS